VRTDPERFILDNTGIMHPPHVPELRLHLATEAHELWLKTEEELEEIGLPPPFWAFAWAGGQGLARYILDYPESVSGKRVLDFASGSGLVAIAAVKAGAAAVVAADIDPWTETAIRLNAALNGVAIDFTGRNLVGTPVEADVLLAGAKIGYAGFGAVGYYYTGSGVGTTGLFILSTAANGRKRDSNGFYGQAIYSIGKFTRSRSKLSPGTARTTTAASWPRCRASGRSRPARWWLQSAMPRPSRMGDK